MALLESLSFIFFVSFFSAVILMIFVYAGRAKLKQQLSEDKNFSFDAVLIKRIGELSYEKAMSEAAFFIKNSWPEVQSEDLQQLLKQHRRTEWLCYGCFGTAFFTFFFIAVMSITGWGV